MRMDDALKVEAEASLTGRIVLVVPGPSTTGGRVVFPPNKKPRLPFPSDGSEKNNNPLPAPNGVGKLFLGDDGEIYEEVLCDE